MIKYGFDNLTCHYNKYNVLFSFKFSAKLHIAHEKKFDLGIEHEGN